MLNHTTLLFAPNLPGIKWNVNKFALIIAQKSPDNHTIIFQFSTFTAVIHQLLPARKYHLWFWRLQRPFTSVSIIWLWITEVLTNSKVSEFPPCDHLNSNEAWVFLLLCLQFWLSYSVYVAEYKVQGCCNFTIKIGFSSPHQWRGPYLDNHTAPLYAQFLPVKNGN